MYTRPNFAFREAAIFSLAEASHRFTIHLRTMRSDAGVGEIVLNRFKFLLEDFQDLSLTTSLR